MVGCVPICLFYDISTLEYSPFKKYTLRNLIFMSQTLEGQVDRIVYSNDQNLYTVVRLKAKGIPEPVTVVGRLAGTTPGQEIRVSGKWETHTKYGRQFRANSYSISLPVQIQGIRKYLGSGLIQGIGPEMANRLVKRFGEKTLEVIEQRPKDLLDVEGIGEKRLQMILDAWEDQKEVRNVMIFLQGHGVSTGYSAKIFKQYGQDAIRVVTENPYRLATDVFGIGFAIADQIAEKINIPRNSLIRAEAGILHVLEKMTERGNVYGLYEDVLRQAEELLGIDQSILQRAFANLADSRRIVVEDFGADKKEKGVYLKAFHAAETGLAKRVNALLTVPVRLHEMDAEKVKKLLEKRLAITPSTEQMSALQTTLSSKISIITGGPGTGKTTLINAIVTVFEAAGKGVLLTAPTGRAAKRLSEVTRHEAKTIHRLLAYSFKNGKFQKNELNPLDADVIIVDEASMVDVFLMYHLLKAVPFTAVLILVGDVCQLPPVGPGNCLRDMIDSGRIPTVFLTQIFRQARESLIVVNAHRINAGQFPTIRAQNRRKLQDFYFIQQDDAEKVVSTIKELCRERIPNRFKLNPITDIQVLTPMHKGIVGTTNLNRVLQQALNPSNDTIERMGRTFKLGDKVMQIRNNYSKEVFNGDIGTIIHVDQKIPRLTVKYDVRSVVYDLADFDELVLAYAVSVHKSQGSEYPAVILPVMTQHFVLLQRNLIYTAVTRARQLVVLIGTTRALAIAIRNDRPQKRMTRLAFRLKGSE